MRLNEAGRMVRAVWDDLPDRYTGVDTDASVVMPNHVHGIVVLTGDGGPGQPRGVAPAPRACPAGCPAPPAATGRITARLSLPDVVHRFKSFTTPQYRHGVTDNAWQPFCGRPWQRSHYEHIIRSEAELGRIRHCIDANPARWDQDRENPAFQRGRG